MTKRAAIYARISQKDEFVDKVENQIEEMRKYAEDRGYIVVEVFSDEDISAYKGIKIRPQFSELLTRLAGGEFDIVLATEQSRFARNSPKDIQALVTAASRAGASIYTRAEGEFDPSNAGSKFMMGMMDLVSGFETDIRVERQKARNRADLAAGIPTKGLRPFGWEKDRITLRESEAAHIRTAIQAILDEGVSVWEIAQRWNSAGISTDGMNRPRKHRIDKTISLPKAVWTTTTVKMILKRPRNAGILMAGEDEMPLSLIQPVVSRKVHEDLQAALRSRSVSSGPRPQYLLGGILECTCGARMTASKSESGRKGKKHSYKIYRCRLYGFDKSQSHVTIQLAIADREVIEWVIADIGLEVTSAVNMPLEELKDLNEQYDLLVSEDLRTQDLIIEGIGDVQSLKGRLRENAAKKDQISARRDLIYASQGHSKEIRDFVNDLAKLHDFATDTEINEVFDRGFAAWEDLPMHVRREIIRTNYRVVLDEGRSPGRIRLISKSNRE